MREWSNSEEALCRLSPKEMADIALIAVMDQKKADEIASGFRLSKIQVRGLREVLLLRAQELFQIHGHGHRKALRTCEIDGLILMNDYLVETG